MEIQFTLEHLQTQLNHIQESPKDNGSVLLIIRRPATEEREIITQGRLIPASGLEGDNWRERGSTSMPDGSANPEAEITLMNTRVIQALTQDETRWALAGDQFFVDFDLSEENIPAGTRLAIGSAIVEVSPLPHNGCKKFSARFGVDALKFISMAENKPMRMRGINAKIIQVGDVKQGDLIRKI
ncbi:MAG: MOSC domain-containing protein [Anaerolineae bacterium]|nr:MOSC domain-containing protein [Anaerolineae bacterium]